MDEQTIMQAQSAMRGVVDEAETVIKYTEILAKLTDENDKAELREIISDELNHLERFTVLYAKLTGIEIAED